MPSSKILLLENVQAQAAAARDILVAAGYRLAISRFEAEGLKRLKEWSPEIVILSSSYGKEELSFFCRRLREEAAGPVGIIVATSLPVERLLEGEPGMKDIVSAVISRPYDPGKLAEVVGAVLREQGVSAAAGEEIPSPRQEAAKVLVVDGDPETIREAQWQLAPLGLKAEAVHWKAAARYRREHGPVALLLGWPVPQGFTGETLREIQEGDDVPPLPVILLSSASLEVVKAKTPALLRRTKVLFAKPVAWPQLRGYFQRLLEGSPSAAAGKEGSGTAPAPSPGTAEGRLMESFQRQLEEKFLETEELRRRLRELEREGGAGRTEASRLAALQKENSSLVERVERVRTEAEVELAKQKFREADLELRLNKLLRQQAEAERRTQDVLDASMDREQEMKRSLAEAHGELQLLGEQVESLKSDLQKSLYEKEEAGKAKRSLEVELAKQKFREADLEMRLTALLSRKTEAERRAQDLLDAATVREEEMQRALTDAHSELHARARDAGALRQEVEKAAAERRQLAGELDSLRVAAEEKRHLAEGELLRLAKEVERVGSEAADLRSGQEARIREKEEALKIASALENEVAELRGTNRDLESKVGFLEEAAASVEEELQTQADAVGRLEASLAEKEAALAGLREALGERESAVGRLGASLAEKEAALAGLQKALDERESAVGRLRQGLEERDHALEGLEEKLRTSEMTVAGLDEELGDWRQRLSEAEAALAAREGTEEELAALSARFEKLEGVLEERQRSLDGLAVRLEASEREREDLAARLKELEERDRKAGERLAGRESEIVRMGQQLADSEATRENLARRLQQEEEDRRELEEALRERESALLEQRRLYAEESEKSASLQEEVQSLAGQLEGLRAPDQGGDVVLSSRIEELEDLLRESQDTIAVLEKDVQAAEAERGSLAAALRENDDFRARIVEVDEQRERDRVRLRDREEKVQSLEESLRKQQTMIDSLEAGISEGREKFRSAEKAAAELRERLERSEGILAEEKSSRRELEKVRESLEARLEEMSRRAMDAEAGERDYGRVSKLLEEVMARAQVEVVERTRKEVELQERLKTSLEEKKFLLARLERELSEAAGRERRLSDLLEKALEGSAEIAAARLDGRRSRERENLPVAVPERGVGGVRRSPLAAAALSLLAVGAGVLLATWGGGLLPRFGPEETPRSPAAPLSAPDHEEPSRDALASQRQAWEQWTRSDVSGGVIFQATLRTREELAIEVEAEGKAGEWSEKQRREELERLLSPYRFDENYYFYLYLKNLQPGYPSYADDIHSRLVLRDDEGNETPAFLPADMKENRRIYSFASGELAQSRQELTYEVSVPVAFARSGLSPLPAYLELVAFNIGSSSRRVLTWELE